MASTTSTATKTAAARRVPSQPLTDFLRDRHGHTLERIAGIRAFPMRPLGRADAAARRYEESVRRRFEAGACNLFQLSIDPAVYRGVPGRERDEALYRLFILNEPMAREDVAATMGEAWAAGAMETGLLVRGPRDAVCCPFRLVPHEDQLFLSDAYSTAPDMVYLSNDSLFFSRFVRAWLADRTGTRAIVDLGTGSGILACSAAAAVGVPATGIDVNRRALAFARANGCINGVAADWSHGSYAGAPLPAGCVALANPPFVFTPPESSGPVHSDGGRFGLERTLEVLRVLDARLPVDGAFAMIAQSPVFGDEEPKLLVELARDPLTQLDLRIECVGTMPPGAKLGAFHRQAGVRALVQVVCTGTRGAGAVAYRDDGRFEDTVCFG